MSDTQKKFYKKIYGRIGEIKAARYLKKQGMKILERNFRSLRGEVDIVAEDGDTLVFVEVKSRSSETYGQPAEAVTAFKQRNTHGQRKNTSSENIWTAKNAVSTWWK